MSTLSPLVPSVNKHNTMVCCLLLCPGYCVAQPLFIGLRRGIVQDGCTVAFSGGAIPTWEYGIVPSIRNGVGIGQYRPCLLVVVNLQSFFPENRDSRHGGKSRKLWHKQN